MRRSLAVVTGLGPILLTGCSQGPVEVSAAAVRGPDATACRSLVDALPDRVADLERRETSPPDGTVAAWGDPAIVLRCGVPKASGFDAFAACQEVNGVGWFIPESQVERGPGEIVMTTVDRAQNVEVRLPEDYWPPAAAMADLSHAVSSSLRQSRPCV